MGHPHHRDHILSSSSDGERVPSTRQALGWGDTRIYMFYFYFAEILAASDSARQTFPHFTFEEMEVQRN